MSKFIVRDLIEVFTAEYNYQMSRKLKDPNYKKLAQRAEYALQFLATVPDDFIIECESVPSDKSRPNFGSMTEIILTYHYNKGERETIGFKSSRDADIYTANNRGIEVKASLNGSVYNTKVTKPMQVYLVNRDGVYIINRDDVDDVIENYGKQGHLPYKAWAGARLHKGLSIALGYKIVK